METGVVATARVYLEGWFDGDVARMDRVLHPNLVRTSAGWKIANALWQPT